MHFNRNRHYGRHQPERQLSDDPESDDLMNPTSTGAEATYLRSLVDSRETVTVVLDSGERLRGIIRYYDRHCFSIGPADRGPKIFIRKESVRYIEDYGKRDSAETEPNEGKE